MLRPGRRRLSRSNNAPRRIGRPARREPQCVSASVLGQAQPLEQRFA
jgi:hypothetical protein